MKDLCFCNFIFGKEYQSYLPLMLFSLNKAYPEYFTFIFIDKELDENILHILNKSGITNYKIIENYISKIGAEHYFYKLNNQRKKSFRWLVYDKEMSTFNATYYIDIDMYYIKEEPNIFLQHKIHCNITNLPYSNIVRSGRVRKLSKMSVNSLLKNPFCKNNWLSIIKNRTFHKLSGLHFVFNEIWFDLLNKNVNNFYDIIKSNKNLLHHQNGFHNECFLYDMVKTFELKIIEGFTYGPSLLDYRNYEKIGFRPHHGIHLGIFRSKELLEQHKSTLKMDFYQYYLNELMKEYYNNSCLIEIINYLPLEIQSQLKMLFDYFNASCTIVNNK